MKLQDKVAQQNGISTNCVEELNTGCINVGNININQVEAPYVLINGAQKMEYGAPYFFGAYKYDSASNSWGLDIDGYFERGLHKDHGIGFLDEEIDMVKNLIERTIDDELFVHFNMYIVDREFHHISFPHAELTAECQWYKYSAVKDELLLNWMQMRLKTYDSKTFKFDKGDFISLPPGIANYTENRTEVEDDVYIVLTGHVLTKEYLGK